MAKGEEGTSLKGARPFFPIYSPKCLEEAFSEVHIQKAA
jgi:hypothetical protein